MDTDEIVRQAMEEEKQRKEAKAKAKGDGRLLDRHQWSSQPPQHHASTKARRSRRLRRRRAGQSSRAWHPWRTSSVPKSAKTVTILVRVLVARTLLAAPCATRPTDDDTDLPVDVEAAEEAAAVDEEDGVKFTAFNLKEERATGYFDEDGGYVERKEEDPDDKDAWLEADGGAVVSEAVRKKIEARKKQEEMQDNVRGMPRRVDGDVVARHRLAR